MKEGRGRLAGCEPVAATPSRILFAVCFALPFRAAIPRRGTRRGDGQALNMGELYRVPLRRWYSLSLNIGSAERSETRKGENARRESDGWLAAKRVACQPDTLRLSSRCPFSRFRDPLPRRGSVVAMGRGPNMGKLGVSSRHGERSTFVLRNYSRWSLNPPNLGLCVGNRTVKQLCAILSLRQVGLFR